MNQYKTPPTYYQNIYLIAVNDLISVNNLDGAQRKCSVFAIKVSAAVVTIVITCVPVDL